MTNTRASTTLYTMSKVAQIPKNSFLWTLTSNAWNGPVVFQFNEYKVDNQ